MSFRGGVGNSSKASMSQENGFDISDLYQNEESIDLSSYMTSANLELCDDDLFQSLFPSGEDSASVVKIEKPDPFEGEIGDWWVEPGSAYSSACSSAAQSPVQFFNTPPVTPKPEGVNTPSPETIRQHQDRTAQFSMSRTQLTPMGIAEERIGNNFNNNEVPIKNDPDDPQMHRVYFVKAEHDTNNNPVNESLLPELVEVSQHEHGHYKEVYSNTTKRSLMMTDEMPKLSKRSKNISKESTEYKMKRERNNIAVRKSRDKAKLKSAETQHKVSELSNENKRLHERVNELTHELNTLKGILKSLPQNTRIPN